MKCFFCDEHFNGVNCILDKTTLSLQLLLVDIEVELESRREEE